MKIVYIALFAITFSIACNLSKADETSIGGTYVRVLENELYTLYDTIVFQPVGKAAGNMYQINERSRTNFKKQEEQSYNKSAKHSNTGIFNPKLNIMHTGDPGILYTFFPEEGVVQINDIRFQKIK